PSSVTIQENNAPQLIKLFQNTPNPFNQSTIITFNLPEENFVTLKIYDINGKLVDTLLESHQSAGIHSLQWNGNNNASGLYFYMLTTKHFSQLNRMILIK
ncbi:T9SS type A sorting domain-containing protein, partial [candidate division KSB1 bacterium]|nr:T9SS type A sorting domain-containing protein [candidate division KSB1 bacterium]